MCQVTIYLQPQTALPVQQYQHNVRYAVVPQRVHLVIVGITWHLPHHALFALISQTAILATKPLTLV